MSNRLKNSKNWVIFFTSVQELALEVFLTAHLFCLRAIVGLVYRNLRSPRPSGFYPFSGIRAADRGVARHFKEHGFDCYNNTGDGICSDRRARASKPVDVSWMGPRHRWWLDNNNNNITITSIRLCCHVGIIIIYHVVHPVVMWWCTHAWYIHNTHALFAVFSYKNRP